MIVLRRISQIVDFFCGLCIAFCAVTILFIRKIFGKIDLLNSQNTLLSLTKDGIYKILKYNGKGYFDWDFTRPFADKTCILFVGNEKVSILRCGKKVIGINLKMPFEQLKKYIPFTIRVLQQAAGFLITLKVIKKIRPKVLEVMFPSKLALRALLLKWILPIKLVTQVRGNLDLIYYFNPFPSFFPFKMTFPLCEVLQVMWDKLISLLFYRSCDLVIGYNINNMLSAISNGSHPAKTKLSRIKIELSMLAMKKKDRNSIIELPKKGKVISLWSRLSPEKCVFEVVKAFEELVLLSKEEMHLVIIGEGPEKSKLYSYVEELVCKNQIHLLGYKDRDFIAQVALHSSLAVVPYGGSSLVEAVMLEVPVVAFDIEWHNELIRNGETGYLADFSDVSYLAEKMHEALLDDEGSRRKAIAAKKLALMMFDHKTIDITEARYYKPLFLST